MAESDREESRSTLPQTCHEDRYQGYKTLIQDIAERLGPEDVRSIAFNQDLPDHHRQPTALEVLQQLERHGLFSHRSIQPLADLLEHIHRNDLVNKYVEPYQTRYGRHSMSESESPSVVVQSRKHRRSHSYPSQVNERINVIEEKLGQAIQAIYYNTHMLETSGNSMQYRRQTPTYVTETQSRAQMSHSKYSEQGSSQASPRTSTPVLNQPCMTPYHENIPANSCVPPRNLPRRAHSIPATKQWKVAYRYRSPPSKEELLQAQREQHFECPPTYPGCLPRSLSPVHSYSAQQPGYMSTVHQHLVGIQSNFEGMHTEGHIMSLTPTLSIEKRRTSAPESYLRRSSDSVNRIHHVPGFYTPQNIYMTSYSPRSSITTFDGGLDVQNLKSPSYNSAMGIHTDKVADNSPWVRAQQPSDNHNTEVPPTYHETVDALDSRMRRLQVAPHSNVSKGSATVSGHFCTDQYPLERPQSGSPLKRFKHRRKSWRPNSQVVQWPLKRNDLNKIVYEHKTEKCLRSPEKLELKYAEAKANPKLVFRLYPYGLEEDYGKNATLEVEIKIPAKNFPHLTSSTKVSLTVTAWDCKEECRLNSVAVEKPMNLRQFTIPEFITHAALKESHSDYIEIQASAELIGLTVEP